MAGQTLRSAGPHHPSSSAEDQQEGVYLNINDMELTQDDHRAMVEKLRSEPHQSLVKEWNGLLDHFKELANKQDEFRRFTPRQYDRRLRQQIVAEHKVLTKMVSQLNKLIATHIAVVASSAVRIEHDK